MQQNKALKYCLKLGKSAMTLAMLLPCFAQAITLPPPATTHTIGATITMHEAVLLALRNNPDIISDELDRVTQKYNLILARNAYMPHLTLGGQFTANNGTHATTEMNPVTVSVDHSALGVTGSLAYDPSSGATSLDVKKELWAGNSYIANMDSLWTAQEQAIIDQLNYRDNIVTTIHKTTQAFRALAASKLTLANDQFVLQSDLEQLKDAKLKLKLGRGTQFDVNQSKLDVSSDKSTLITDKQTIQSNRVDLNQTLGLDPQMTIHISNKIPFPPIVLGTLQQAQAKALATSTAYQQAQITLNEAKRKLAIDKNASRPTLTYEAKATLGDNTPGSHVTNAITWGIPIDNVQNKYNVLADRIAIIKDKQALTTTRNSVISTMTLDYNNLQQTVSSWHLANQKLLLNEETVKQQTAQYQAGQLGLYDLSTAKQSLTTTRNSLQTTKNSLWDALESFRTDTGTVLSCWGISLRPFEQREIYENSY